LHDDITLQRLGWSQELRETFVPFGERGLVPGRVAVQHRGAFGVYTEHGEVPAEIAGRLRHESDSAEDLPAAGDWVAISGGPPGEVTAIIHAVLPRRTKLSRKVAWLETGEQIIAANVDVVLVLTAMNGDLNLRRLERYLTTVWESGAEPGIVLTKADLADDVDDAVLAAESVGIGVPVHVVSSMTGLGVDEVRGYAAGDRTIALLGSSGVGKSTLLNRLVGEELLPVQEVRADGRGRHTTTRRELVLLPGGGLVLDTPGMRELQLWDAASGIDAAFEDVEELARTCRFADCAHETEPGCGVLAAVDDGRLELDRLRSWRKLQRELRSLALKQDQRARSEERRKRRVQARSFRKVKW
jgi:ribosome biogenesis GTPase / thiamine phosphate phosphatase